MVQIKQVVPKEHHIREECGVFGVFSRDPSEAASLAYYGLFALQHRGQENAGIAVNDEGVCTACCDEGLVNEGFPKERIKQLGTGNIVVGHVRQADRRPGSHDFRPLRVEETSDRRQHQAQSHPRAGGGKAHHADQRFHRPGNDLAGATDLLCRAGAKEIRMRVSAPPFVAPCCCGTDIDVRRT